MTQQIDLNALSINDLKALAYDCIAVINKQQQNLQMIDHVILEKTQVQEQQAAKTPEVQNTQEQEQPPKTEG